MKIAVVGSGISGNAAAWALSKVHDVTVFEKRGRPGGHSATVDIDYDGKAISVDTGFIVYNEQNYPQLTQLFDHLEVKTERSNMTFSVSLDDGRMEWCGSKLKGIFAQPGNLVSIGFLRMLREIFRFNSRARQDLDNGALCGLTLDEYLKKSRFSTRLKNDYLVPMTSAIWSTPSKKMLEFPAESLVRFMKNHSLIQKKRPDWRTVTGGSREYVAKLIGDSTAEYRLNSEVVSILREPDGVKLTTADGSECYFDEVVIAAHSDQAMRIIKDADPAESDVLGSIQYVDNDVWLHRDPKLMPRRKNAWAAWNYLGAMNSEDNREVSVTYWMNRLQNIDEQQPIFVTLNPLKDPRADLVFGRFQYSHPLFNSAAIEAQGRLKQIQGKNGLWFCGAWTGYGFHEDGLGSGLAVAQALGASIPWETSELGLSIHSSAYGNSYPLAQAAE